MGTVKKRQAYDNPEHQPATKTAKLQGEHTSAVKSGSASVKPPAEKDKKRSSSGTDKKSGKSAGSNEGKTHVTASTSSSGTDKKSGKSISCLANLQAAMRERPIMSQHQQAALLLSNLGQTE